MIVGQLNQKKPFEHGRFVLYADEAVEHPPVEIPGSVVQSQKMIELRGVAARESGAGGSLRREMTSQRAVVAMFRDPYSPSSIATVRLTNPVTFNASRGAFVAGPQGRSADFQIKWRLPSPFQDNPKFFTWTQLHSLGSEPERYDLIAKAKEGLSRQIASERVRRSLIEKLSQPPYRIELAGARPGSSYIVQAPSFEEIGNTLSLVGTQDEPVGVVYTTDGDWRRSYLAQSASLIVRLDEAPPDPQVVIELVDAQVRDASLPQRTSNHTLLTLPSLVWTDSQSPTGVEDTSIGELWQQAQAFGTPTPSGVAKATQTLHRELERLGRRIVALLHERAAAAVACLLLVLLGAIISILLKGQLPLVAYFWTFLLAILSVIIVNAGQNMAGRHDLHPSLGLSLLWSGNALLTAILVMLYGKLARN